MKTLNKFFPKKRNKNEKPKIKKKSISEKRKTKKFCDEVGGRGNVGNNSVLW